MATEAEIEGALHTLGLAAQVALQRLGRGGASGVVQEVHDFQWLWNAHEDVIRATPGTEFRTLRVTGIWDAPTAGAAGHFTRNMPPDDARAMPAYYATNHADVDSIVSPSDLTFDVGAPTYGAPTSSSSSEAAAQTRQNVYLSTEQLVGQRRNTGGASFNMVNPGPEMTLEVPVVRSWTIPTWGWWAFGLGMVALAGGLSYWALKVKR